MLERGETYRSNICWLSINISLLWALELINISHMQPKMFFNEPQITRDYIVQTSKDNAVAKAFLAMCQIWTLPSLMISRRSFTALSTQIWASFLPRSTFLSSSANLSLDILVDVLNASSSSLTSCLCWSWWREDLRRNKLFKLKVYINLCTWRIHKRFQNYYILQHYLYDFKVVQNGNLHCKKFGF